LEQLVVPRVQVIRWVYSVLAGFCQINGHCTQYILRTKCGL
jgi:hypothetical protein